MKYVFSSVDFNECQMRGSTLCTCADGSYGNCGAQCNNTHGSFSCSCGDGFRLLGKTKCVGVYVAQLNTSGQAKANILSHFSRLNLSF